MKEKEERIKRMVAEGKVSEEEGKKLLDALKESEQKEVSKSSVSTKEIIWKDSVNSYAVVSLVSGICSVCFISFSNYRMVPVLLELLIIVSIILVYHGKEKRVKKMVAEGVISEDEGYELEDTLKKQGQMLILLFGATPIFLLSLSETLGISPKIQGFLLEFGTFFMVIMATSMGVVTFKFMKRAKEKGLKLKVMAIAGIILGIVGFCLWCILHE